MLRDRSAELQNDIDGGIETSGGPAWVALPGYSSVATLTDAEWAIVQPLLRPAKRGGRPRIVDLREVLNGLF